MLTIQQSGREPRQVILESIYASITDPLLVMDRELMIVDANDHLIRRLGKPHCDVIGKPWSEIFPHLGEMGRGQDLQSVLSEGKPHQGRIPLVDIAGEEPLLFDVMTYPVFDTETAQVTHLVEYARDVTAEVRLQLQIMDANNDLLHIQEQMERKTGEIDAANRLLEEKVTTLEVINEWLGRIAVLDVMTDLPNHRGFQEQLTYEMHQSHRSGRPFCLLLLDVDDFKSYNDQYGHPQGDILLAKLAYLMRGCIRITDLPARYGGEEFAVLLPDTNKAGAALVAERLRAAVASEELEHGMTTISIGVAEYPADAADSSELIQRADKAMYHAKAGGKNAVCLWNPEQRGSARELPVRDMHISMPAPIALAA